MRTLLAAVLIAGRAAAWDGARECQGLQQTAFTGSCATLPRNLRKILTFSNDLVSETRACAYRGSSGTMTYIRASVATHIDATTGLLVRDASGVPRFERAGTSGLIGVYMETSRTNAVVQSDDLTQAAWVISSPSGLGVTKNLSVTKNGTGPDGIANSASTIQCLANGATMYEDIVSANTVRTQSLWIQRIAGTGNVDLTLTQDGSAWVTLTITGSWAQVTAISNVTCKDPRFGIRMATAGDVIAVTLLQVENGAFPTSAIPTTTVAVTRAADQLSCPSAGNITTGPGTMACTQDVYSPLSGANRGAFGASDGTDNNAVRFQYGVTGFLNWNVISGGVNKAQASTVAMTQNVVYSLCATWRELSQVVRFLGVNYSRADTVLPASLTTIYFGTDNGQRTLQGHVGRCMVLYPEVSTFGLAYLSQL